MSWDRVVVTTENGDEVDAVAPLVLTASRATDIPAFFGGWFFDRLKAGYLQWVNPFNGKPQFVALDQVRFVVFWTKHPSPGFIRRLDELERRRIGFSFQYTLNDYEEEELEPRLPSLEARIKAFRGLSGKWGCHRVVWRFDPLVLTEEITVERLLGKIERVGDALHGHTEKLVFSFADIEKYRKVRRNMIRLGVDYRRWAAASRYRVAEAVAVLNEGWGLELATCCEPDDLSRWGITHNSCVDPDLIIRLSAESEGLKRLYTDRRNRKDRGQRKGCLCGVAKDIGRYDTCRYSCAYCYANTSPQAVEDRLEAFEESQPTIGSV